MSALLVAVLAAAPASAAPGACEKVRIGALTSQAAPGVLFLGERHASRRDLARAKRIVKKLAKQGPVTLALEPIWAGSQRPLDRLQNKRLRFDRLAEAVRWSDHFAWSFDPYVPLLSLYEEPNVRLVAVGHEVELPPADAAVTVPPGYASVLADATGDGPVPPALSEQLAQTVAWHDRRVAQAAIDAWDGQGWLVVLVDRTWIEGGLGMPWQAAQLTPAPVHAALLADAGTRCYAGDQVVTSFLGIF